MQFRKIKDDPIIACPECGKFFPQDKACRVYCGKECADTAKRRYQREYHKTHSKRVNEVRRAYYYRNREKMNARCMEYYKTHREEHKAYTKKYYLEHKEQFKIRNHNYNKTRRKKRSVKTDSTQ